MFCVIRSRQFWCAKAEDTKYSEGNLMKIHSYPDFIRMGRVTAEACNSSVLRVYFTHRALRYFMKLFLVCLYFDFEARSRIVWYHVDIQKIQIWEHFRF